MKLKMTCEVQVGGWSIQLDLSRQILGLDIPKDREVGLEKEGSEPELYPTLPMLNEGSFTSASVLAQKAKQFDDGLYAAVELAAQEGAGSFQGKAAMLSAIAAGLSRMRPEPGDRVAAMTFGAMTLGRIAVEIPVELEPLVQKEIDDFLDDELRSRPLAFYTWSERLEEIFRQDRLLQSELTGSQEIGRLVRAIHSSSEARVTYEGYLALVSKLTNPFPAEQTDLRPGLAAMDGGSFDPPPRRLYLFPPSRSHETDLIKQMYGNARIPEGFSLAEELIKRIQRGDIDLEPGGESGWYDYQIWSLEPLVVPDRMPEAARLRLTGAYRSQLLELFKGLQALGRETHVKQLETRVVGAAPGGWRWEAPKIEIVPELSVEPLPVYYLRRAKSYTFVRSVLDGTFGAEALARMQRVTPNGSSSLSLSEELEGMEVLFRGASLTASRQLGMSPSVEDPGGERQAESDAAAFLSWAKGASTDPDLGRDSRMMVPVFYDIERRKTKAWVFLGWTSRPMEIVFSRPPAVTRIRGRWGAGFIRKPAIEFGPLNVRSAYPVTAEVYVKEILDRNEFRRRCDQLKTRGAILRSLE